MLATIKNLVFHCMRKWFRLFGKDCTQAVPEGSVLVIAPHPDDETIGCGAAIARFCAEGRKVRVIIVTDGGASSQSAKITPAELVAIRQKEALSAAKTLGLSEGDVIFLSYPDSHIASHRQEILESLLDHITRFFPSVIFTSHRFDEHEDHRVVASIVEQLKNEGKINASILQYPVWYNTVSWPYGIMRWLVSLSTYERYRYIYADAFLAKKREALLQYRSQFENLTGEDSWQFFSEAARRRYCHSMELFLEPFAGEKQ